MSAPVLRPSAVPSRRGVCPGLSRPLPTGDGLLVRILPIGTIALDAFAGLCAAARDHGNGIIEITARGSIQVRGLSAHSAPRFADAVAGVDRACERPDCGRSAGDGTGRAKRPGTRRQRRRRHRRDLRY